MIQQAANAVRQISPEVYNGQYVIVADHKSLAQEADDFCKIMSAYAK